MESRKIDKSKVFAVFVIATALFISGFLVGNQITQYRFGELEEMQKGIKAGVFGIETEFMISEKYPCETKSLEKVGYMLDEFGRKMTFTNEESRQFKDVNRIKSEYFAYELRHFFLIKDINEKCDINYIPILFFYQDNVESSKQGAVLTKIKSENTDVMIYSFEHNIDISVVDSLSKIYNITSTPSTIINEQKYEGFVSYDDLLNILK